ncbi:MAG: hypothetical protein V2B14_02520 [bacterium]
MSQENHNLESMSKEIRDLVSNMDKFLSKKNEFIDNFKKNYLNCSNNN